MTNKLSGEAKIQSVIFWALLYSFWLFFYWNLSVTVNTGDYYYHNLFAKWMFDGDKIVTYPGYHILSGGLSKITGLSINACGAIWLAAAMVASVAVTYLLIAELCGGKNKLMLLPALAVNVVQPIFFYGYAPGYSSGNGYVSPTQAVCKPFALLTVLLFYRIYKERKRDFASLAWLTLTLVLSCVFKPLFAMAFVPAMGLLLLYDRIRDFSKGKCSFWAAVSDYVISVLPLFVTGIVLLLQFFSRGKSSDPYETPYTEAAKSSKICFGFMRSWSMVVDNVWVSILLAYALPLVTAALVLCAFLKKKESGLFARDEAVRKDIFELKPYLKICGAYGAVSFAYFAFLYQTGRYTVDCNFRNGWVVTFTMVYIATLSLMWRWITRIICDNSTKKVTRSVRSRTPVPAGKGLSVVVTENKAFAVCCALLAVHLLFGAALIAKNFLNLIR